MANEAEDDLARIYRLVRLGKEVREEKLKAARRCSDCQHFFVEVVSVGDYIMREDITEAECMKDRFGSTVIRYEGALRPLLRTAATCTDYEEASDG